MMGSVKEFIAQMFTKTVPSWIFLSVLLGLRVVVVFFMLINVDKNKNRLSIS